ncbi:MAG: hypothetical protein AMJ41_00090 [candidate division Zixibacteria bacterium DG_27]|nr:MAG: hypothetical protein AMJ41_00090 [candidate division Zixibacteria bacterium DG_27]
MTTFFYQIDHYLFVLINSKLANPVFDFLMPIITNGVIWRYPIGFAALLLLVFGGKKGRLAVLFGGILILLSDQTSSHILKPFFHRIRPCHVVEELRLLVGCGNSFSFPSSHATNNFAAAVFFSSKYRRAAPYLFAIAVLVSYSRTYIGIHYPLDLAGGAILGMFCAFAVMGLELQVLPLFSKRKKSATSVEEREEDVQ